MFFTYSGVRNLTVFVRNELCHLFYIVELRQGLVISIYHILCVDFLRDFPFCFGLRRFASFVKCL